MNADRRTDGKVARAAPSDAAVDPTAEYLLRRRRGLLLWILPIAAAMFVASWLARDDPQWQQAVAWARTRAQQWEQDGCPVTCAPHLPRNARNDVAEALLLVHTWPADLAQQAAIHGEPVLLSAEQVASTAAVVAALRRAAHRADNFAPGSERVGQIDPPDLEILELNAAFGALCGAAAACRTTAPREAAAILGDGLVTAADLLSAGFGIERLLAPAFLLAVIDGHDDALLGTLAPADLQQLDATLVQVVASWPPDGDWIERELAHGILYLEHAETLDPRVLGLRSYWQTWDAAFSTRRFAKRALEQQLQDWLRIGAHLRLPGTSESDRETMLHGLAASFRRTQVGALSSQDLVRMLDINREALAALLLLRGAVLFHLRQPIDLPDPFADGPLQVQIDGDRATLRSARPDLQRICERRR